MDALEARFRRRALIGEAQAVLHWDAAVTMPPGGAPARGEQLAELRVLSHELLSDPRVADLLDAAGGEALDPWRAANLAEMRRLHAHATALPGDLVAALSRATSACEHIWREAKAASDFARVEPAFAEVLRLTREAAAAKAGALSLDPYDALLDRFEPGARFADIAPVFDRYAAFLSDALPAIEAAQEAAGAARAPRGPVPADAQRGIVRLLAEATGFDFDHGRLDESAHPFSTGWPGDRRITVRYEEDAPIQSLMAVLHECGHALYEAGLPGDWARQPVGGARGMQLHESQSLMVEMQACRSDAFLRWAAPLIAQAFGDDPAFEADNLIKLVRRVERGFIRVEADEATYPAHIILRTRLERAMIAGDLAPADLPAAWNEGFEEALGRRPPDDARGCLQDIHWYDGAFGYFPTYTLGAMTAAQLFQAALADAPGIEAGLARGDFGPLIGWARAHVHKAASSRSTADILTGATGRPLDPQAFIDHIRRRYLPAA